MGREYYGDIEGKFAFGIQNSNDIENLITIDYREQYCYYGCGCIAENINEKYCKTCYNSFDEHLKIAKEEDCIPNNTLIREDNIIIYEIEKDKHFLELKKKMIEISDFLPPNVINEFKKIKNNEEIIDGYSKIYSNVFKEMDKYVEVNLKYLYLYKLGIQIEYILKKQDKCMVYCEVY